MGFRVVLLWGVFTFHFLLRSGKWDDEGPEAALALGGAGGGTIASSQDDEYRWAGVEDPKIVITTSRDPSSKLKQFA